MVKKGDTLIEVTLAIGIFSMIAIGIAAVMSSGTAGAQTALETTLTREEIDTQAEALRFIQNAYIVNKDSTDERFSSLWKTIKDNAINDLGRWREDKQEAVLQYAPVTCSDSNSGSDSYGMYNSSEARKHAFVINPRKLGTFKASTDRNDANGVYSAYIPQSSGKLTSASIYPRLVFSSSLTSDAQDALINDESGNTLYRAEGIYVLAVKDSGTTEIVDSDKYVNKTSAYYDFYIRACWYGANADEPSTISTVIRLYDPDTVE
ncbi:MAG: hypothetical protein Q4F56_00845 [Candidatus Saccharibacteria bacterium]|nr:hypothetical protein [Candidatus Saccharibacteria bacterium]